MSSAAPSSSASTGTGAAPLSERAAFQLRRRLQLESELSAAQEQLAATEAAHAAEAAAFPTPSDQLQLQSQRAMVAYLEARLRPEELRKIGRRVKVSFDNLGGTPVQLFRLDPHSSAPQRVCRLESLGHAGVLCHFGDQFHASPIGFSYPVSINFAPLWDPAMCPPDQQRPTPDEPAVISMKAFIVHEDREVPAPEDCYDKH